jgi:hypothetical protein
MISFPQEVKNEAYFYGLKNYDQRKKNITLAYCDCSFTYLGNELHPDEKRVGVVHFVADRILKDNDHLCLPLTHRPAKSAQTEQEES